MVYQSEFSVILVKDFISFLCTFFMKNDILKCNTNFLCTVYRSIPYPQNYLLPESTLSNEWIVKKELKCHQ